MKKQITFIVTACIAIAGLSDVSARERTEIRFQSQDFKKHEIKGEITVNGETYQIRKPDNLLAQPVTRAQEYTPVITEAPGVKRNYTKDVIGYGYGAPLQGYAVASSINWDGDDAYFKDIITGATLGTYVKGSLEDAELVIPLGQNVLEYDDEDYTMVLGLLRTLFFEASGNKYVWFVHSDEYDSMSFSVNSEGTMELIDPEVKTPLLDIPGVPDDPAIKYLNPADNGLANFALGYIYSDDKSWSGFCDVLSLYDEFNYPEVEVPENLDYFPMTYINNDKTGVVAWVAETGNDVYVKGLSYYAPEAVFKGELLEDGTRMSVAPNQFIGLEGDLYYIITSTTYYNNKNEMDAVKNGLPSYFDIERDDTGQILTIKAEDSDYFLSFNDDPLYFYEFDSFEGLVLEYQNSLAGIPSTPYEVNYEDYSDIMGSNWIFFRLSSFANDGGIIDVNNLYYSVYLDEQPIIFEEETAPDLLGVETLMYGGIKEPTTMIPYLYYGNDLFEDNGGTFCVAIYASGYDTVGVEAVYVYNGEETRSPRVTVKAESSIDQLEAVKDTVKGIYNLQGIKVDKNKLVKGQIYIIDGKKVVL